MYNRAKFHPATPNIMAWVRAQTNKQTNKQTDKHTNEVLYSIDIVFYSIDIVLYCSITLLRSYWSCDRLLIS